MLWIENLIVGFEKVLAFALPLICPNTVVCKLIDSLKKTAEILIKMVYYSKRITKFTLNMTYGLLCLLQLVFTRCGMKKTKFWQLFAVFSPWYQTEKTAFISLVRSAQSLKLSQCIIISPKFSTGFKSG